MTEELFAILPQNHRLAGESEIRLEQLQKRSLFYSAKAIR